MGIIQGARIAFSLGLLLFCGPGDAQEAKYLVEKPVGRLAIVIGNSAYENASTLPGTIADAKKIKEILDNAKFDVTFVPDVKTRADFLTVYFLPFLDKIHSGDFVVFYFSGHGFNYGGENYLVPLKFPTQVLDSQIFSTFMSVRALQAQISDRHPGVLLMFLDACRDITNFVKVDKINPTSSDEIAKALSASQPIAENIVVGFSSDAGKTSIGSDLPDQLSVYTAALSKYIPEQGTEFDTVRKDVREEVLYETNERQAPWFSESSSSEIYFEPSELILDQELDLWKQVLLGRERRQVIRFLRRHSVSNYAAAARQWLGDHPQQTASAFSRISPIGPELAWAYAKSQPAESAQSAKIRNFDVPFGFDRTMRSDRYVDFETNEVISSSAISSSSVEKKPAETVASLFTKQGEAVVTGYVSARDQPNDRAKVSTQIDVGTKVQILGYETDASNKLWVKATVPKQDDPVFIQIPSSTKLGLTNIGKPLLEIKVAGSDEGLTSSVDEKPVLAAIEKLRAAKSSIEWVSIATPDTDDPRLADIFGERATFLINILNKAGISSLRISTVEKAGDLKGMELRVRIFGN